MKQVNHELNDLIEGFVELYDAAIEADYTRVRRLGGAFSKYFESLGNPHAAKKLRALSRKKSAPLQSSGYIESLPVDSKTRTHLLDELGTPESPLFLTKANNSTIDMFIKDVQGAEKLIELGLSSQPRIMLSGPPGTGKTLLATHIASRLNIPIYVLRLDSVISSFLGETAKNLRNVFDFFSKKQAVLLIDEIDAVAKLRNDKQDLGELKRVVNTLIQGLDALDDRAIVVGATNHWELLDKAIWRRFTYKLFIDFPNLEARKDMIHHFLFEFTEPKELDSLAKISKGLSGADLKSIAHLERRNAIINNRDISLISVIDIMTQYQVSTNSINIKSDYTPEDKRELAFNLKTNFKLTQSEIARLFGVSRQTISKMMRRKSNA